MLRKLPVDALRRAGAVVAMVSAVVTATTSLASPASAATVGCPATPSFDFTVPLPAGPPSLLDFTDPSDGLQDVDVAIVGSDHQYYNYNTRFGFDTDEVGPLACLQGSGSDQPAVALPDQGDQHFVLGNDHSIMERDVVGDALTDWTPVPGSSSRSGVDALASGDRTDIFYASDNAAKEIIHQWKVGDQWVGIESLGGATDEVPSVTTGADGKIHVWVAGLNHKIYVNSGVTGGWSGWHSLSSGLTLQAPAAAVGYESTKAREDLFVTGTNGFLYQAIFTNLGAFSGFHRILFLGGADARLSAASQGAGHMVVMWTRAGQTAVTQYVSGHPSWLVPYLPTYLCPDCAPLAPPATNGTSVSPKITSRSSLAEHRSAPHRH